MRHLRGRELALPGWLAMTRSRPLLAVLCLSFGAPLVRSQERHPPFPVDVLVKAPADTQTELQVICLFHSDPSNTLHGSLTEINQKLGRLLDFLRAPSDGPLFAGDLGETLLISPKSG